MKPRHAAALALVGWYMITPPVTYDPKLGDQIDFKAPLTEWTIDQKYDSKEDCTKALGYRELLAERAGPEARDSAQQTQFWLKVFSKAQCREESPPPQGKLRH